MSEPRRKKESLRSQIKNDWPFVPLAAWRKPLLRRVALVFLVLVVTNALLFLAGWALYEKYMVLIDKISPWWLLSLIVYFIGLVKAAMNALWGPEEKFRHEASKE
jgi:hypothetical protein